MVDDKNNSELDAGAGGDTAGGETAKEKEDRTARAKAFYRAMYAGEDVAPTDFGMGNQGGGQGQSGGAPQEGPPPRSGGGGGPCMNCAELEARTLEAENHYKRMAADFENYRRRVDREKEEFQGLGIVKAIEAILPALDDMDRAKQSLANVTDPAQFLSSFDLVFNRFTKCMEGLGIKQMEVVGEQFDPRLHEPVQEIETQEYPDNAVVHELRRGYMIKDKVLRPTLVNVASNPSGVVIKKEAPAPAAAAEAAPAKAEAPAAEANPAPAVEAKPAESAPIEAKPAEATPAEAKAAEAAPVQPAAEPEAKAEEKPEVKAEAPPAKEEPAPAKAEEPAAAAPPEPVAAAAEAPAEPAKEDAKAEGSTRQRKDTKSRAKQSETGDLSGALFDATSTADLPIFEIDQIGQGLFSSDDEDDFEQLSSKIEGESYELKDAEASTAAVSDKSDSGKESDE